MAVKPVEIDLGNGYGYFCNIPDIENQYPTLKLVVKPKCIVRRKHFKKINMNEDNDDNEYMNYLFCACIVILVVVAIYVCFL